MGQFFQRLVYLDTKRSTHIKTKAVHGSLRGSGLAPGFKSLGIPVLLFQFMFLLNTNFPRKMLCKTLNKRKPEEGNSLPC